MDFLDPLASSTGRVVLASVYPFIWDPNNVSYSTRAVAATLKAECLVQKECSIPGSMVLENPNLRHLIRSNPELLTSGALVLDLRSSAHSFQDLACQKYGVAAADELRSMADFLDEHCPRVLHFDPQKNSDKYRQSIIAFLSSLRRSGLAKKSLDALIERIQKTNTYLTLAEASTLTTNIASVDRRILEAARFFWQR